MKSIDQQKGVGLIEVLIAGLVFAVGITAVVQLQGTFFISSSAANARSIAMSIAQEKIEDLRGFQVTDSNDTTVFDFTSISSGSGGQICKLPTTDTNGDGSINEMDIPNPPDIDKNKDGVLNGNDCVTLDVDLLRPSVPVNATTKIIKNNISFSRTWAVINYYYKPVVPATTPPTRELTTTANGDIVQKEITVNVEWTDTDGSLQTANLSTVINKFSGAALTGLLANNIGGSGEKPMVSYTPSTGTHVAAIGVGTDTKRETLVPSSQTVGGYSRSKFIAYTYSTGGKLMRQEEFENVACDCRFNGTSDATNKTFTAAHHLWDTATDTYVDVDGDLVSGKVRGCVQSGGTNCDTSPEPLCDICCRDHHDTSSAAFKFDPFRSTDDFTSGDHNHYNGTNSVTSGQYLEACRLKRVNGYWRVFQDWNLVKFTVLPLSDLTNSTTKATYTAYVQAVIDAYLDESKVSGEVLSSPPAKPSSLDHTVSGNYISMAATGNKLELTARGIYLDFIDSTHLTKVKDKKSAVPAQDYLLHLPFYELEVAPVSSWLSADSTKVRVGPFDGPGLSNDLTGGELAALANNVSGIAVSGTIRKSNSGIVALGDSVDYNAATNPDSATQSESVSVVCAGCTGTPSTDCTTPWGATVANGSSVIAYTSLYGNLLKPCASQSRACTTGTLSGTYAYPSCTFTLLPTCTTTITGTAGNKDDTITLLVDGSPNSCTVASSKKYTCPAATTPLISVIAVTSVGSVNSTKISLSICGLRIIDFP